MTDDTAVKMTDDEKVEEVWETFWKDLVTKPQGVSLDRIKKELYDYHTLLTNVPIVYGEITDGMVTKPNTNATVVIGIFNDYVSDLIQEAVDSMIGSSGHQDGDDTDDMI